MQIITRCVQIGTVAMLFSCGLAMAQLTETFTASTPYTDLANYGSAASGPELEFLAFPLFNSSLGTLTGISLTVTGGTGTNNDVYPNTDNTGDQSQFSINNTGQPTADFTQQFSMQVYIEDQTTVGELACVSGLNNPGDEALPVNAACLVASLTGAPLAFSNVQTVGAGGSYVTPLSLTESTTVSDPNYSEFSSLSAGNIMLPVFVEQTNLTSTDNGNGVDPLYVAVGVNASITYTYDSSTPEPASMLLMGLALTALGIARRKKRT